MTAPINGTEPQAWTQDHARRYLEARYGKSVWFRAPETFGNTVERWIWAVASDAPEFAEEQISAIEAHFSDAADEPEGASA